MSVHVDPVKEAAMLKSFADQVQFEVVDVMEANQWRAGFPVNSPVRPDNPDGTAAPKPVDTPAAPAVEKTDNPTLPLAGDPAPVVPVANMPSDGIDWEALKDPTTGLYGGKYKTKIECIKGIGNVVNMTKQALSKNALLEKEISTLKLAPTLSHQLATPVVIPPTKVDAVPLSPATMQSTKLATVLTTLIKEGGIIDEENLPALLDGISDQANLSAAAIVDAKLAAQSTVAAKDAETWNAVDEHMRVNHPRSFDFVDEMGLYVQANPVLAKAVKALSASGDHIGATDLAWSMFELTLPPDNNLPPVVKQMTSDEKKQIELEAAEQVRKEAVDQARLHAGVAPANAGGVHERVDTGSSRDEIALAAAEMHATGIGTRWRELAFGKELTGPLFD